MHVTSNQKLEHPPHQASKAASQKTSTPVTDHALLQTQLVAESHLKHIGLRDHHLRHPYGQYGQDNALLHPARLRRIVRLHPHHNRAVLVPDVAHLARP